MLDQNRPRPAKAPRVMPNNPKPVLDVYRVPVFRVHQTKLEAYIHKVFGFEFDLLIAAGITEGQCIELEVNGNMPSTEWERRASDLRCGQRTKSVVLIMAVLCKDGYIPAGKYTISTHPLPDPTTVYTHLLQKTGNPQSDECVKYRKQHQNDNVFRERAAILDQRFKEAKSNESVL